ncbi:MAG: amino acid permease [Acidobacteria bacterium]|nr:amino acid permease [Acidobacteriota bacterium]
MPELPKVHELRRELGLPTAIAIVIGTVIGSGIFLVPKTAVLKTGSVDMVFLVWIFGGLLSLAGALTYAELAAAMPEAGGEYVYLREAYGPFFAFVYGWTQFWVAKSGSLATLATGFFLYVANLIPALDQVAAVTPIPLGENGAPLEIRYGQLFAIGVLLILAVVNYFGVREGGNLQIIATVVKVALIGAIIAVGLFSGEGKASNFATSIPSAGGITGFFGALVAILWAYDGWNNVSMVSSEIKDPQRNLPKALIIGSLAVMAIYLLANVAYFFVLSAAEVAASDRVAAEMMRHVFGPDAGKWVSVAAMISIFAALNGSYLGGSRIPYAMARDGLFFKALGEVHPVRRTPGKSILWLGAWASVLVLSGRYDQLFTYVIFASWILYGMAAASVLVLRYKRPDMVRPYRTLGYPVVPVVFVLVASLLIFFTLRDSPRESIMGLLLIVAGVPFYFYWKKRLPRAQSQYFR